MGLLALACPDTSSARVPRVSVMWPAGLMRGDEADLSTEDVLEIDHSPSVPRLRYKTYYVPIACLEVTGSRPGGTGEFSASG